MLCVVCCLLVVVCWLLCFARCWLFGVVCSSLFVDGCLLMFDV